MKLGKMTLLGLLYSKMKQIHDQDLHMLFALSSGPGFQWEERKLKVDLDKML